MSFEEGDRVRLADKHSDHDGETGTIDQVMETMFGDATYTVSFEDGQETGVPADALGAVADDEDGSADDEAVDAAGDEDGSADDEAVDAAGDEDGSAEPEPEA